MSEQMKNKLVAEAKSMGELKNLRVPLDVLQKEAVQVAKFIKGYWEPKNDRPGLKSAGRKLSESLGEEILLVRDMVQDAQTDYAMFTESEVDSTALLARGNEVLSEIVGVTEWFLDDGIEDETDARFAALKTDHEDDGESAATLAQALHDYATLAKPLAAELNGLGNFDAAMIEEAFTLADQLGEIPSNPNQRSEDARNIKKDRDQLAGLLHQRISLTRSAARFVFRDHPQIYREISSAYERARRAAAKRAQQNAQSKAV